MPMNNFATAIKTLNKKIEENKLKDKNEKYSNYNRW